MWHRIVNPPRSNDFLGVNRESLATHYAGEGTRDGVTRSFRASMGMGMNFLQQRELPTHKTVRRARESLPFTVIAMPQVLTTQAVHPAPERGREHIVNWLRELEACRSGGLVSDEEYGYQRAEKLDGLLRPPRLLWLAPAVGAILTGCIGGSAIWWFTKDWSFTTFAVTLSGLWGINSIGRLLREKLIELQLRGRRKLLLALLENDLVDANEFADFDERLETAHPGILKAP